MTLDVAEDVMSPMRSRFVCAAGHVVAALVTTVLVATVPIVGYGALVVRGLSEYGDPGGLLNLILIPLGSLLLGVAASGSVMALSIPFHFSPLNRLPLWAPMVLIPAGVVVSALVIFIVAAVSQMTGASPWVSSVFAWVVLVSVFIVPCVPVYWSCYLLFGYLASRIIGPGSYKARAPA